MLVETALRYSLAASLAYLPSERLASGRSDYAQRLSPQLQFAEQVTIDELAASCTIFEGADDGAHAGELLVAFRGSTKFRNYQSMFNLGLVPSRISDSGRVHTGYQEASERLYERLAPVLEQRAPARTVFVGHSYGGGTATMCALLHSSSVSELVTFAGPRVGDAAFADSFNSVHGATTTHLVHDLDPVLAQNQPLWNGLGFVHTGRVVRCSATEPRLLDDDEGRSGLPLNFADHARYLGTFLGPR